jgi:hypothetical protein
MVTVQAHPREMVRAAQYLRETQEFRGRVTALPAIAAFTVTKATFS